MTQNPYPQTMKDLQAELLEHSKDGGSDALYWKRDQKELDAFRKQWR